MASPGTKCRWTNVLSYAWNCSARRPARHGARGSWMTSRRGSGGGGSRCPARGAWVDGRRENPPGFCRDREIGRFPECFPSFQKPGAGSVETGRFRGGVPKKVVEECVGTGETGKAWKPRKGTESSEPLVRGHPCPHWRSSGVRPDPSAEPNGLEHANRGPSLSGSSAVTRVMRAGLRGSQPGSACALAGPTRSIARTIRSRLSVAAQASEVSPACNQGNPAGEGAGAPRDANGPGTTMDPCSDAGRPAVRNRPRASGMCPGSMELTPG